MSQCLTPLRVGFVSLASDLGCSALAQDLAQRAADNGVTVAFVDLTRTDGALGDQLDWTTMDGLSQVACRIQQAAKRNGVTIVHSEKAATKVSADEAVRALEELAREHTLFIVAAQCEHPLWEPVRQMLDRLLVVTDHRPEIVAQALQLLHDMGARGWLLVYQAKTYEHLGEAIQHHWTCVVPETTEDAGNLMLRYLYTAYRW